MLALGAHMSIAGGCDLALERAAAFAMEACQLFTKNASQWNAKPLDPGVVERFQEQRERTGIRHLVAHDSYLINLASPDEALRERSYAAFRDELDRCELLGVPYLVTHPGGHMGSGVEEGVGRVAAALNRLHGERPDAATMVLLETTAGQGTHLGRTFEELAEIIALVEDRARVGVCFDTCHAFAAGYDLRDREGYETTMRQFEAVIGFDRLRVLHLNDSKKGLGSRVDRHAHIGEGELGAAAFGFVLSDPRLDGLPGVLETPKGDDGEEDRRNLATLSALAGVADASLVATP
jgi:deoxyribonuclease-4